MSNGSESDPVLHRLVDTPYEFDFVQAVHLIQHRAGRNGDSANISMVGFDSEVKNEAVRFRVTPTLRNVSAEVIRVEWSDDTYELTIPFIGLTGTSGVLPRHYTQTVLRRLKQHDYAMRDFYDLFHHRIVSLFFRATTKYDLPAVYQSNSICTPEKTDVITSSIFSLLGLGSQQLRNKRTVHDYVSLRYGGHFSDSKPTGHSLERMLGDFSGIPTQVKQFQFEWIYIPPEEQTQLQPNAPCRLGQDIVIGEKVPSFQSRFRIVMGPVGWNDFLTLLPTSEQVTRISELVRSYVGISLDYELQVVLDGKETPELKLDSQNPPMLGWTTWLRSEPDDQPVTDAVFDISQFQPIKNF
ncbi:MAG: type VI secretion system baseplate subunit TssG [Planctomycetota bacterium]